MMKRELIFVNSTGDTFTPTHSGAIATWIWEMCRAAQFRGLEPWVLSRDAQSQAYPWVRSVLVEYPFPPRVKGVGTIARCLDYVKGWPHVRQGEWKGRLIRQVNRLGLREGVFVLHNDPELLVAMKDELPRARFVHLFHNCNPSAERWRRRFAQSADCVLAVSAYCAKWVEGQFGCAVHILRNGVDSVRFSPGRKAYSAVPVIGFVGRTDRHKAPDLLLRAALHLAERGGRFSVQLLGSRFYGSDAPDGYQRRLHELSQKLEGRGIRVDRPGFVNRFALPRFLAASDIHVVPSRWEDPCPLTVLEGMATGQATVASACGGIPEIVGSDGFIFERDDLDGLSATLRALVENVELRENYGKRARERARRRPWSTVFEELSEALTE